MQGRGELRDEPQRWESWKRRGKGHPLIPPTPRRRSKGHPVEGDAKTTGVATPHRRDPGRRRSRAHYASGMPVLTSAPRQRYVLRPASQTHR